MKGHPKSGMANSWHFNNVTIDWPMRGIVLDRRAAGHVFTNLIIQPNTLYKGVMIDVASHYNSFQGMIWDVHSDSTIILRKSAESNWFSNMGRSDLYERFVTDYTPHKARNTFSTSNPFERTKHGYNYYTMSNLGIGIHNNINSQSRKSPRLSVRSDDYPAAVFIRKSANTGGNLNVSKGAPEAITLVGHTSGFASNGFGTGITFLVKDPNTDTTNYGLNRIARILARRDGGPAKGALQFFTTNQNAESPSMTIRSSGNVGIGTSNPSSELEVEGTTTINDVLNIRPRNSAPANPKEGMIYINSSDKNIYCYLGGKWVRLNN
jgi:hypothetical protein